jgi:hypothetical protein
VMPALAKAASNEMSRLVPREAAARQSSNKRSDYQ